jgi:hypothetical protein
VFAWPLAPGSWRRGRSSFVRCEWCDWISAGRLTGASVFQDPGASTGRVGIGESFGEGGDQGWQCGRCRMPYEQAPRRADILAVLCHGESPPLPSAHPDDLTYGVRVLTVIPRSVMEDRIKLELPGHTWPQRAPTPSTAVVPFVRFGQRKRTCASSKSSHREKPRSRCLSSGITSKTPLQSRVPPAKPQVGQVRIVTC